MSELGGGSLGKFERQKSRNFSFYWQRSYVVLEYLRGSITPLIPVGQVASASCLFPSPFAPWMRPEYSTVRYLFNVSRLYGAVQFDDYYYHYSEGH